MRTVLPVLAICATAVTALLVGAPATHADPPPGCLYQSPNWYDPCSGVPPWVQQGFGDWSPVDGVPGMWGPHGYTPPSGSRIDPNCLAYNTCTPLVVP